MPGTVKSGLLSDADRSHKCDCQDKVCWMRHLLLDKGHFITETGDFKRFAKGNTYAAFLGLVPGERSSSTNINRLGISKTGNTHLRCLLIEAAKGICKGVIGHKSRELRSRQSGQPADVIAYADKANTRLRSKYYKMTRHGKKKNVSVAAVARELACFIWGMMTGNISITSGISTSAPAVSQG